MNKEIITNIEEVYNYKNDYDGYKITTNKHTYLFLITNMYCCCEDFGYFSTNDDTKEFINSELLDVSFVDMSNEKIEEILEKKIGSGDLDDGGGIQFVNFETSNGLLQFAVYNAHNGYYGHDIRFIKDDEYLLESSL